MHQYILHHDVYAPAAITAAKDALPSIFDVEHSSDTETTILIHAEMQWEVDRILNFILELAVRELARS
jgi:hypothetical protein